MIKVGIAYEVVPEIECDACCHKWTGILETNQIDWGGGHIDVRVINEAECPECGNMTYIKRIKNGDEF